MHAIDTNVLVRLITRDDPRQTASAENFIDKGAWVSALVLVEAIWVLGTIYELDSKDQAKAIQMLLDHRELVLDEREIVGAALELFRARPTRFFRLFRARGGAQSRASATRYFRSEPFQGGRNPEAIIEYQGEVVVAKSA